MCDTLGRIGEKQSFFAKNSDRSPNEVQLLEYYPGKTDLSGNLSCTYISIPQAQQTYAVLLSRPCWMWGAEMGVNEFGLCIGNEAVFTRGAYGQTGLTGMDMVRLGLERCKNAKEAVSLLTRLLETYGQGGNCGFDHEFYYDNAFLIMDAKELYVLETAGKAWAYKRSEAANISNRLSLGKDADAYFGGRAYDFKGKHLEPVYSTFSGSASRKKQVEEKLPQADSVSGCIKALQCHEKHVSNPFSTGSVSSPCMHFGGMVGDHTTASMVVCLEAGRIEVWSTGSSLPCVSLFKPWRFGADPALPVTAVLDPGGKEYWMAAENFRRSLLGKKVPKKFHNQRDAIQKRWLEQAKQVSDEAFSAFAAACLQEEKEFYDSWKDYPFEPAKTSNAFLKRWEEKNRALK